MGGTGLVLKIKHPKRGFEALKIDYSDGKCIKNEMEVFKKLHNPYATSYSPGIKYLVKP